MTMAAERLGQEGQSILEFLILLPMMMSFVLILVKTNSAIQSGIVNQQYARLQTQFLAFNSAWFPDLNLQINNMIPRKTGVFALGISEDSVDPGDETFEAYPKATIFSVARTPASEAASGASDDAGTEDIEKRVRVRIRTSAAICSSVAIGSGGTPLLAAKTAGAAGGDKYGQPLPNATWQLSESTIPQFCIPDSIRMDP